MSSVFQFWVFVLPRNPQLTKRSPPQSTKTQLLPSSAVFKLRRVSTCCCIPLPYSTCHKKSGMEMKQQPRTADITITYMVMKTTSPCSSCVNCRWASVTSGPGVVPSLPTSPVVPCSSPVAQHCAKLDINYLCACTACAESSVQEDPDHHWNKTQAGNNPCY